MAVKFSKAGRKSGVHFDDKEVMDYLTRKVGPTKMRKIFDLALEEAGQIVLDTVKSNIRHFRYTGAEHGEVKLSKPKWEGDKRAVSIYWEGEKDRYKVVHLNEKGFRMVNGKFFKPKGFGSIDRAMRSARESYYKKIKEEIEKHI